MSEEEVKIAVMSHKIDSNHKSIARLQGIIEKLKDDISENMHEVKKEIFEKLDCLDNKYAAKEVVVEMKKEVRKNTYLRIGLTAVVSVLSFVGIGNLIFIYSIWSKI